MLPPVVGVLFDGFAYGMLLFLLSVGLSVTLGHDEFRQPGALRLRHARRLCHRHADERLRWPFFATLPIAFLAAAAGQRRVRARALPAALPRQRSRPGAADHRHRLHVGRGRRLFLRHRPSSRCSCRPICAARSTFSGLNIRRLPAVSGRHRLAITLVLVAALEYTRFGAQVRAAVDNQRMARGLGINVDRTFAVTFALGSGLAGLGGALAIEIVGLDPTFRLHLSGLRADRRVGRRARLDRRLVRRRRLLGISDIAGKYYVPQLGAFLIYLVMVVLLMWRPAGLFGRR